MHEIVIAGVIQQMGEVLYARSILYELRGPDERNGEL